MSKEESIVLASLIIPIFNEEQYIEKCVHSLLKQDISEQMEIILVDGNSTDNTIQIIENLQNSFPKHIRILQNPKKIQASAMNIGAANASGTYLLRIDAHVEYPENYVSTCIGLLEKSKAENAGCITNTKAKTKTGKTIAKLLTSSFGVGGSAFRIGAESGYTDTVPFGAFRRDYFLSIGGFDERLVRSEDNEFNYRLRKNGGKIYMTNEIQTTYYCRETVKGLTQMAFGNGKWNIITGYLCPGSISLKYFIPLLFTLSLIIMPVLSVIWWPFALLFIAELLLYLLLVMISAIPKIENIKELPLLAAIFPVFHICYGTGSICGIWAVLTKKYRRI